MSTNHIYLDHSASTPVHPKVIEAMLPYWTDIYGNPSSSHEYGRAANHGLNTARRTIAGLLNAQPKEIIFTGCGSESNNLALRGTMWAARANGRGHHLITSCIEHKAVLETAIQLRDHFGFEVTILPVDSYGRIRMTDLQDAIRPETALISIMAANNEIGTLQPILEIGALARDHDILFHTDAVQAVAYTRWDMQTMPIDMLSIAPHKFYGPKGIGLLYVRDGVELVSALTGGDQEDGRRSGTENVPYAVGAAEAFRLATEEMDGRIQHDETLRDRLIEGIRTAVPDACVLTGHPSERLPHHASFAFRHLSGNDLLIHLDIAGICASSGSACKTGDPKPSAILEALGLDAEWTTGGLRLTVGRQTSMADIEYVIDTMPGVVEKARNINLLFASTGENNL